MSIGPSTDGQGRPDETARDPARVPSGTAYRVVRGLVGGLGVLALLGFVALAGGFVWFVESVPKSEVTLNRDADGIVVLTGGASRIPDAIELLAAGHGRRLLITGVHRTTSSRELARLVPRYEQLLKCCVDLDHSAINTVGNAAETRRWVKDQRFTSVIVVTSSYHMPRSMAELGRQLPDVRLIAFPVVTEKMRDEAWWDSLPTARLLMSEYLKYVYAQIRMRIAPGPDTTDVAGAHSRMGS
jgi:uncharacterized SAM-binding protein YcdF (DUF218 family)